MRIAFFYFAYFSCTGLVVPYLTAYYKSLGFSGQQVGLVMSLSPLAMVFIPPVWGLLADRTQRPTLILRVALMGLVLSFMPLLWTRHFAGCLCIMAVAALFQAPVTALSDTVAVLEAQRLNTTYERLRLWGSIGFIASSWSFSWYLSEYNSYALLPQAILGVLMLAFVATCLMRRPSQPIHLAPPAIKDALHLAKQPGFLAFLIAGTVHWASCSPSYILFTIHLEDLHIDLKYAGWAFATGVTAEVVMMWAYRSVRKRIPLFPLLGLSFALTSLRWFVVARVNDGPALAAIQILHGFTFGAFYVGVISYLEQTVPPKLRATGRALFTSISIGLGGLIGHQLAGYMYDLGHTHEMDGARLAFYVAACIEWLAPVALLLSYKWSPPGLGRGQERELPEPSTDGDAPLPADTD